MDAFGRLCATLRAAIRRRQAVSPVPPDDDSPVADDDRARHGSVFQSTFPRVRLEGLLTQHALVHAYGLAPGPCVRRWS